MLLVPNDLVNAYRSEMDRIFGQNSCYIMTIRPVDFATIQRTDDVGAMKHRQDTKPVAEQQTIQVEIAKQEQNSSTQVRHANDTSNDGEGFDAREQGKNRYRKQKGGKGKAEKKEDGKVIAKSAKGGFDIKI